jgi:isoleucyl-tRNA synthetase
MLFSFLLYYIIVLKSANILTARLASMIAGRTSWCISRQRAWGVPIPVFYHRVTGEPLLNEETLSCITMKSVCSLSSSFDHSHI